MSARFAHAPVLSHSRGVMNTISLPVKIAAAIAAIALIGGIVWYYAAEKSSPRAMPAAHQT